MSSRARPKAREVQAKKPARRKPAPKPRRFQVDPLAVPLGESSADMRRRFGADQPPEVPPEQRIEVLPLEMVEPDPWNPRHILPERIRARYLAGELDAETAVKEWVKAAANDQAIASQIDDYRAMGETLLAKGQINPINVAKHFRDDGSFIWRVESGERRYWAKWLLVVDGKTEDGTIHAVVRDQLDASRQAVENLQSEALSAVGQARQVARLVLDRLSVTPNSAPAGALSPGSDDYFRLALLPPEKLLSDRQRLPKGFWPELEQLLRSKRQHLERKLEILRLPNSLLQVADTQRLTERQLREILSFPAERWEQVMTLAIEKALTGPELAELGSAENFEMALQQLLERREVVVQGARTESGKKRKPGVARRAEQVVRGRVIGLVKFIGRALRPGASGLDIDQVVEDIINTGEYKLVLDYAAQLEVLLSRLRARVTELEAADDSAPANR